jgi:hypothetical protein
MKYTYSVLWRNGAPPESGKIAWHIREIKSDGSFYGEIRFDSPDPDKRLATIVEGSISGEDLHRCFEILDEFSALPIDELSMKPTSNICYGNLGRRDKSSMRLLGSPFVYNLGDESNSDKARLFIELIEIMEKEVSKSYHKIGQGQSHKKRL